MFLRGKHLFQRVQLPNRLPRNVVTGQVKVVHLRSEQKQKWQNSISR
jgi:hypothetical protein